MLLMQQRLGDETAKSCRLGYVTITYYYMNCMTFLLGNQHWDDFGLSKMGDTSFLQTDKSLAGTSQHARIAPPEIQKKLGDTSKLHGENDA